MYNIILDKLPNEYMGYLIRSDFRIGIQLSVCLSDVDLSEEERIINALLLLFGNGMPPFEIAYKGLIWFLSCGQKMGVEDKDNDDLESYYASSDSNKVETLSFEQDIVLIYSAFRRTFNIDLAKSSMHWFEFNALLNDIGECSLSNIIQIRTTKQSDIPKDKKAEFARLKRKYEIKKKVSQEELAEKEKWSQIFN